MDGLCTRSYSPVISSSVYNLKCVMFLLAGYETTLACLVFTTYLLAIHPDIQDKVCAEIQEVLHEAKATRVTLDLANKMPYLGMVINESLRLYPPVTRYM